MHKLTIVSRYRRLFCTKNGGKNNGNTQEKRDRRLLINSIQAEFRKHPIVVTGTVGTLVLLLIQHFKGKEDPKQTGVGKLDEDRLKEKEDPKEKTGGTAPTPIQSAQVGNIAEGLAWSHYIGYTRIVLRELVGKIKQSQLYKGNENYFPLKEFNIFPYNAKSVERLSDFKLPAEYYFWPKDHRTILPIKADHGSFEGREHEVTVYTITDPKTVQTYYFVVQIPHSFTILGILEDKGIINKTDREKEVERYMDALRNIVYRLEDQESRNVFRMIPVPENIPKEKEKIAERLLKYIKDDSGEVEIMDKPKSVFVDYTKGIPEDEKEAQKLKKLLEQNEYNVLNDDPGIYETQCMVLVVSRQSLEKREQKYARKEDLKERLQNHATLIVVCTDDLTEEDLTYELRIHPHTFLRCKQDKFLESLLQEVKHGHRDSDIPDTAKTGLAYAYVYNYLETNLKDAGERMKRIHLKNKESKLYKKLLIVVPKLFVQKRLNVLEKSETGEKIAGFEALKPDYEEENVSGMECRKYQLIPYKVTENTNPQKDIPEGVLVDNTKDIPEDQKQEQKSKDLLKQNENKKEYLIMAEYPNPVICLQCIREEAPAHWTEKKLEEEVKGFIELTKQLIESSKVLRGKVQVLEIDDTDNVKDAIVKFLKEQEETNKDDFTDPISQSTTGEADK